MNRNSAQAASIRDYQIGDWVESNADQIYRNHNNQHLRNALRFAEGCGGWEAKARCKAIKAEMNRRKI